MTRYWVDKFQHACRGLVVAFRGESTFLIHLPAAAAVVFVATVLRVERWEWCVLLLCVAMVIAAELFNTSIEILVRRLHPDRHDQVGHALDIAAAAVLVVSLAAAVVGVTILTGALFR